MAKKKSEILPLERIQQSIFLIRGKKIMLDEDLALLYGVETRVLTQAVRRHENRFPPDFMFRLTLQEFTNLKSQSVTSSWGGRRKPPMAFTEQGIAMLSSVLNSEQAVEVNILIMRAFVQMRQLLASNVTLARRIDDLEKKFEGHEHAISVLFDEIRQLLSPPEEEPKGRIGFRQTD